MTQEDIQDAWRNWIIYLISQIETHEHECEMNDVIHVRNESTKRVRIQMTSLLCPPRAPPVRTHYHPHGLQARDKLCPGPHLK